MEVALRPHIVLSTDDLGPLAAHDLSSLACVCKWGTSASYDSRTILTGLNGRLLFQRAYPARKITLLSCVHRKTKKVCVSEVMTQVSDMVLLDGTVYV